VLYVGKGRLRRAWDKSNRNKWWNHINDKVGYTVELVEKSLSSGSAFELEIELIKFYRSCGIDICNLSDGGEGNNSGPKSEDIKTKMAASQGTIVYCSNGMSFVSGRRARAWLRISGHPKAREGGIYGCCKGVAKTAYGFVWSYEDVFRLDDR
jgi:hypothetical protein